MPFASGESRALKIQIFKMIYHAALEASSKMAEVDGPYDIRNKGVAV
jgi:ribonucleotide reductase alpha subunit